MLFIIIVLISVTVTSEAGVVSVAVDEMKLPQTDVTPLCIITALQNRLQHQVTETE